MAEMETEVESGDDGRDMDTEADELRARDQWDRTMPWVDVIQSTSVYTYFLKHKHTEVTRLLPLAVKPYVKRARNFLRRRVPPSIHLTQVERRNALTDATVMLMAQDLRDLSEAELIEAFGYGLQTDADNPFTSKGMWRRRVLFLEMLAFIDWRRITADMIVARQPLLMEPSDMSVLFVETLPHGAVRDAGGTVWVSMPSATGVEPSYVHDGQSVSFTPNAEVIDGFRDNMVRWKALHQELPQFQHSTSLHLISSYLGDNDFELRSIHDPAEAKRAFEEKQQKKRRWPRSVPGVKRPTPGTEGRFVLGRRGCRAFPKNYFK